MIFEESFGIIALKKQNDSWFTFLVQLKSGNHWGFPKGHANISETAKEAAKRELKEESNLEVKTFLDVKPLFEQYQITRDSKTVVKKVYYYPALVDGDVKIQKNEIIEGSWVELEKAENQITYPQSKSLVNQIMLLTANL